MATSASSIERQQSLGDTLQEAQFTAPTNPFKDRSTQIEEERKKKRRRLSDELQTSDVPSVSEALGLGG